VRPFLFSCAVSANVILPLIADLTLEEVEAIDRAGAQGPPTPVRVLGLTLLSHAHTALVRLALGTLVVSVVIIALCHLGWLAFPCMR
jgi:hypothetical protein